MCCFFLSYSKVVDNISPSLTPNMQMNTEFGILYVRTITINIYMKRIAKNNVNKFKRSFYSDLMFIPYVKVKTSRFFGFLKVSVYIGKILIKTRKCTFTHCQTKPLC